MALQNKNKKSVKVVVNICRFLLAVVMTLSGFLKATDPVGAMYKLEEYTTILSMGGFSDAWLLTIAVLQSAFEFLLGLCLLVGIYRRVIPLLALVAMSIFMPLSLYIWQNGSMADCGCFGEAFIISNKATFIKNLFLLIFAVVVFWGRRLIVYRMSARCRWILVLFLLVYIFAMQAVSIWHLPLLDSGPYAVGENIRAKVSYIPDEYDYLGIYRKGNEEIALADDDNPGAGWKRVGVRPVLVKQGTTPEIANFSIVDWEWDIEYADSLLADTGYVCFVAIEKVEDASMTHVDKINDLYEHCDNNGIRFCAATASIDDEIVLWRKRTGAEYPLFFADEVLLRSMIRSNPGLLLFKDGVVVGKWNVSDIPDVEELAVSPTLMPDAVATPYGKSRSLLFWVALLVVVVILVVLFDAFCWYMLRPAIGKKLPEVEDDPVAVDETEEENTETSDINKNTNLLIFKKMRKNIVAGNWKMNMNLQEGIALAKELNEALTADKPNCDVVICTPFIHLASVTPIVDEAIIGVGAENCADKVSGAYTGEVSASMVASTGAKYVILGHSERRAYYGETAEILKEKVQLALANGLTPIFCIGEVLEERNQGIQNQVVYEQLAGSLYDLSAEDFSKIILAYEPVWAIGTGLTATPEQAEEIHAYIRSTIAEKYGNEVAENTSILYGGSCKPSNAKELFANPNVDGGLIGGAALKVADFKGIIDAFK